MALKIQSPEERELKRLTQPSNSHEALHLDYTRSSVRRVAFVSQTSVKHFGMFGKTTRRRRG